MIKLISAKETQPYFLAIFEYQQMISRVIQKDSVLCEKLLMKLHSSLSGGPIMNYLPSTSPGNKIGPFSNGRKQCVQFGWV